MRDAARDGVGGTVRVGGRVAKEIDDVARRGEADAQHERILRRIDEIVKTRRIETLREADP